ncbi:MAG: hypothetical protein U0807_12085 [Candidatus Binatia bacterium]
MYWIALYSMTGTVPWYLASLWIWLGGSEPGGPGALRRAAAFAGFIGALLSSEHAITLPVALLLGSVLIRQDRWRSAATRLAPFFVVSLGYAIFKMAYMRWGLDSDFPNPVGAAVIRLNYQPVIDVTASLRLLGFYTGCALGLIFDPAADAPKWYAIAVVMLVITAAAAWSARVSIVARRILFGLLLFMTALAPILLLPGHVYTYYVGTAAAGLGIAIMAAAGALGRAGRAAAVVIVALILVVEVTWAEPRLWRDGEFAFYRNFQRLALRWIAGAELLAAANAGVTQMVVQRDVVTERVFNQGMAQRLFLGASYQVRLVDDLSKPPLPGTLILNPLPVWTRGTNYPGRQARFDWLRGSDPWAKE